MKIRAMHFVAILCMALPWLARADPLTFVFTGTVTSGLPAYVGQTLQGTVTYDVSLSTNTSTCCGIDTVAQSESAITAPGAPAYAWITLMLSGGSTFTTGNGLLSNYGGSEVIKQAGEEGSPGPLNRFGVESSADDGGNISRFISLQTSDMLGASSMMFPDGAAGLANDQAVNWLAPGAIAIGSITLLSGGPVGQTVAFFSIDSIAAVPELSSIAMLLLGLGFLGGRHWQRGSARKALQTR